ncbi:UbiA family prenyltransferase [Myxococcota bacterium]|nr:UbiA family prenyltransferase [Myxococcota bacterium]
MSTPISEAQSPRLLQTKTSTLALAASISRIHIVTIAALGTLTFGWIFTGEYFWTLMALAAADWFVVNLLNRVVDIQEDKTNDIPGTTFVERNQRTIAIVGFGLLIFSFGLTYILAPEIVLLRIAYHTLGLAYNWPIFPGARRLKELYFFKNTSSALGFIITVFLYPMSEIWSSKSQFLPDIQPVTVVSAAIFFFLFELSYEVIYDLRDAEGDRLANIRSFIVAHGQKITLRIIYSLLAVSSLVLITSYMLQLIPWRLVVMAVAPLLQAVLFTHWLKRGITSRDCVNLTWIGATLLLFYNLWVFAGLPLSFW